ncbi:glycogen debranching enzyme GlgX [Rheinheimera sp. A13L]|uniref:glycogen debranching protein GlgX n=1 Tax=Rheinheimera sp. A13L TaxID=506534 RepID=UPI0002124FE0|nr:glycogen debranching protein GlgX [Rheinheimera sp. A13L]EGM78040.1 glycogen debranching enzyme GlgX [Rheinheimera sp. A13L]
MSTLPEQNSEWISSTGAAYPPGPSQTAAHSWNFSVYAPDASSLWLCLFCPDTEEPLAEIEFFARTGDVWHLHVEGIQAGTLYGLRATGVCQASSGLVFDRNRLLIDPYAKQLNRALVWNERLYQVHSHYMVPKGVLASPQFDWQNSKKPLIPREKTIIYEAHVKGLTKLHPDVPEALRGKYQGMCHPAVIKHLKELGITTVQLLPVASFMSEPRLEKLKLTNYWGYNPINFFAPDARYQVDDAVTEFKDLVCTYHQHGLEVILDVVFNHTAEAEDYRLSFRGLANRHYYLFENHADITDYQQNCNYSGCGNTLNVAHPVTQRLVLDALRYWATEMQVDGFRFDLAVTLAREHKRFDAYATFLQVIAQDPVLSQVKLIAEPWDLGPFGYQLGQFPAHWSELNDKCRDSFRSFWRQDPGQLPQFATRLLGSRDIFQKHHKPACCSVNYISYHDGFTLQDMVCYQDKHNWLNAEQNRDGHGHNLSLNYGVEGPSSDADILQKRFQHKRNLVASLMLSQGIVHWLGGDELSHTQQGNNNAYCQDNEMSWLHWQLDYQATQFLIFVKKMIQLRQKFSCLQQLSLLDDQYQLHGDKHQVSWYLADGSVKQDEDWTDPYKTNCVFVIEHLKDHRAMLVIMNAGNTPLQVELPKKSWQLLLDTQFETGEMLEKAATRTRYVQSERSLSIWT